ncbi:carboxymuconolactone decarboxylase family protein [Luteimonas sp. RD2P54]|uniref:Carboxymuconolactone decarboxylase family protein n=1 Tax=Luteimonas endophytica TaxID=3042023 RepID=A0ABT6J4Z1_9GAMM|nr:carboxymuconolactone decarboxylase family protein [Luteimonas endophytica]MDH5821632.1 carboxymuconolactone decarboxylase family protein [Luteimonas endophytica]
MSQHPRVPYPKLAPKAFKAMLALAESLHGASLGPRLSGLVKLRVSQINGCAYCLDMHARELREAGEDQRRLDTLAGWRESRLFDAGERAALGWAESLTRIERSGAADADYAPLLEHFDETAIAELSFLVVEINGWNRLAVGMRTPLP